MSFDDDQKVLAAEYVLGTLDAVERAQVEAMMAVDADFATLVQAWERRLGELHVMVEPVEPPAEVWDKIKAEIAAPPPDEVKQPRSEGPPTPAAAPDINELHADTTWQDTPAVPKAAPAAPAIEPAAAAAEPAVEHVADKPAVDGPVADDPHSEMPDGDAVAIEQTAPDLTASDKPSADEPDLVNLVRDQPAAGEPAVDKSAPDLSAPQAPSAQVVDLTRRLKRWRGYAVAASALAAALVLFVAFREFVPDLQPKPKPVEVAKAPSGRLVAMLQKQSGAPAFLLTVDLDTKTLIVRRVEAEPRNDKSYELWLVSKEFPGPRSLGVVGAGAFTRRTTLAAYDPKVINDATYAISLEPQGGSPTGAPTGPVLFTGKLIEATPPAVPPPGG